MELCGKKVIVTGGVRGLGRNLVEALVAKEALITVFDLDADGLAELHERYPGVNCVECDVADSGQVTEATARYHAEFKSADVLVNNAGILFSAPLVRISGAGIEKHDFIMWNKVIATDLSSVFYMTAHIVETMIVTRTKGVIVNISSVSASGNAGQSAYSAAKAGVNALTATWAKELGTMGIRVVAVAPGFTETESTKEALSEAVLQETIKRVPLRRLGKPQEIAHAVISVIENDFFNGKVYEVDGGLVI
ncbi:MAG: SDR family oxidoreductase [Anaerolineales bacterium]|nr:SDR family oxidoreductase [Anaerolineales bacterium]